MSEKTPTPHVDAAAREEAILRKDIEEVLSSQAGQRLFAWLHRNSGYAMPASVVRDREILPLSSAYNDGRRALYITLRGKADPKLLRDAEELSERRGPAPTIAVKSSQEK